MTLPRLLSAAELAAELGQDARWIYRRASDDGLPAVRVGRSIYFDPAAVSKWIDTRRTTTCEGGENAHPQGADDMGPVS